MKIRDIKDTLNADSRNVSILCTSPNINKWSKWKPVRFNKDCNITPLDLYSVNYGLMLPVGAATPQLASDNEYVYQYPTGGNSAPFRMGDFRDYNHNAIPPVSNYMGDVTVDVDMMNNFQFGDRKSVV